MKLASGSLYGNVLRKTVLSNLTLTETVYLPNQKLPKHSHEQAYFCFVLTGAYTETFGPHSRSCQTSSLIFHPADETHADYFHSSARCFNIEMTAELLERLRQYSLSLDTPAAFNNGALPHLAMRLYAEFCRSDNLSSLIIEGLALEMMGETAREGSKKSEPSPPTWLKQVHELLNEQFPANQTLDEIAQCAEVHPVHLAREFRRFYRCTVGDYIRRLRVEFACRKLATSDDSLSQIAFKAGFFDQSHFTRTFKAFIGQTPQEYRKNSRPR